MNHGLKNRIRHNLFSNDIILLFLSNSVWWIILKEQEDKIKFKNDTHWEKKKWKDKLYKHKF